MKLTEEYLRGMIDTFGYRALFDAANEIYGSIPEARRLACKIAGQHILDMRAAQRAYEQSIIEPV